MENPSKVLVSPRTMMKVPRTSRTMMKAPRTMLNKKGCWEIPGCDGVGVMGHVSGVMVVVVIFLSLLMVTTGSWVVWVESSGSWVESPGCDGVGVVGYVSGVMGVMIIFLSLLMVTTGSWARGACDGISLKS